MNFAEANEKRKQLDALASELSLRLQQYPKNEMGLVPEEIRFSEEYRKLAGEFDTTFRELRNINAYVLKHFKREHLQEQARRRAEK